MTLLANDKSAIIDVGVMTAQPRSKSGTNATTHIPYATKLYPTTVVCFCKHQEYSYHLFQPSLLIVPNPKNVYYRSK